MAEESGDFKISKDVSSSLFANVVYEFVHSILGCYGNNHMVSKCLLSYYRKLIDFVRHLRNPSFVSCFLNMLRRYLIQKTKR